MTKCAKNLTCKCRKITSLCTVVYAYSIRLATDWEVIVRFDSRSAYLVLELIIIPCPCGSTLRKDEAGRCPGLSGAAGCSRHHRRHGPSVRRARRHEQNCPLL